MIVDRHEKKKESGAAQTEVESAEWQLIPAIYKKGR
jgi:hypothetical protein